MNTADYLLELAQDQKVAIIADKTSYTYADLKRASARVAGELTAAGVAPGDRVGLVGSNSFFWAATYLAVLKLSVVALPFSITLTPPEVQLMEQAVPCKAMCGDRRALRRYGAALRPDLPVISDEALSQPGPSAWPVTPMSEAEAAHTDAALMFTSGTTARPRAVRVTHRNIQANTNSIIQYLELTSADCMLAILQFYYCFGTSLLHTHLRVGGSLALCNTFAYPETALDLMEATNSTGFAGVPSTYQTLLRNSSFPKRRLPLRKLQQAGGKLPTVFIRALVEAVPEAKVYVMYGQTEGTARLSYLPPELLPTKLGSIGQGIPGVELRVLGEDGQPVKPGEVGEIVARGDNVSPGYLNEPEATAAKFRDGCLYTGDLATVDEDGFIFVVDRKDDFIKSYGFRVSSQQVEAGVLEVSDVVEAAAVGAPDPVRGEAIIVYISLQNGSTLTPEAIIEHCRSRLARHMVPKEIVVLKNLPLSAQGKVLKSELRKLAQQAAS